MPRLVAIPERNSGRNDAPYMRVPLLGDGVGLIEGDIAGEHWAVPPQLLQLFTDVEAIFVYRTGKVFNPDINDGALLDGLFDRRGRRDREVLAPAKSLLARLGFTTQA